MAGCPTLTEPTPWSCSPNAHAPSQARSSGRRHRARSAPRLVTYHSRSSSPGGARAHALHRDCESSTELGQQSRRCSRAARTTSTNRRAHATPRSIIASSYDLVPGPDERRASPPPEHLRRRLDATGGTGHRPGADLDLLEGLLDKNLRPPSSRPGRPSDPPTGCSRRSGIRRAASVRERRRRACCRAPRRLLRRVLRPSRPADARDGSRRADSCRPRGREHPPRRWTSR